MEHCRANGIVCSFDVFKRGYGKILNIIITREWHFYSVVTEEGLCLIKTSPKLSVELSFPIAFTHIGAYFFKQALSPFFSLLEGHSCSLECGGEVFAGVKLGNDIF